MNLFDRARRSRLLCLALAFSVLAPLAGLPARADEGPVPEIGSGAARTRRPWFGRQIGQLLSLQLEAKDAHRTALVAALQKKVNEQSDQTRKVIQGRAAARQKTIVDVAVIGGGIHAAIFNSAFSKVYPEARVLTIEGSNALVKTFNGSGPVFRINSPELGNATANLIQESPVQLAQITTAKFANAELLGQVALFALYNSTTNFLMSGKVSAIQWAGEGFYAVRLEEGLVVYAKHVVVATGLGAPALKVDEQQTLDLVRAESTKTVDLGREVPDIQFFDDAVVKAKLSLDMEIPPLTPYAGKRVAVVGAGDAGNVWIEFLLGKAPPEVYARTKAPLDPAKTIWIGQKARNFDEWKAANKPRYHEPLKDLYNDPRIEMHAGKLANIRPSTDTSKGRFAITIGEGDGATLFADKVIISTGYNNLAPELVKHVGSSPQLRPMLGAVKGIDHPTALSLQAITSDGKKHNVYVVGPAAAPLATDEEVKLTITKNHHSINVLGPRTEGLALFLASALMGQ